MVKLTGLVLGSIFAFFLLSFLFIKLIGGFPLSISSVVTNKSELFTSQGYGEVPVAPDVAVVRVGVSSNAPTVKQAQDQMNASINKISQAVKNLGVENQDIKTESYNISPQYDYNVTPQKITGYSANSSLAIKIKNIDQVNSVIDSATANGANNIGGVTFEVNDPSKAQDEARIKAVADAKQKAELAAKTAGFQLGRLVSYYESTSNGGGPQPVMREAMSAVGAPDAKTQVETGSNLVSITVNLGYEIK